MMATASTVFSPIVSQQQQQCDKDAPADEGQSDNAVCRKDAGHGECHFATPDCDTMQGVTTTTAGDVGIQQGAERTYRIGTDHGTRDALLSGINDTYEAPLGFCMPSGMSDDALDRILRQTIESIGPLYNDDDDDDEGEDDGYAYADGVDNNGRGVCQRDDESGANTDNAADFMDEAQEQHSYRRRQHYDQRQQQHQGRQECSLRARHTGTRGDADHLFVSSDAPTERDDDNGVNGGAGGRSRRPQVEDEPLAKRRQVEEHNEAPPRPRRGRPPGRTSGPRAQPLARLPLGALCKRFVRDSVDAVARETCEVRLVRTRLDAMDRQDDGQRHVDHNGVRMLTADDGTLPSALSFRRALDASAEALVYTCVADRCGRRFRCANQNALIGCTPYRSAHSARDEASGHEDAVDDREEDNATTDPSVDGVPVDGFVCPLHGARHAYCASCLIAHMQLDQPLDDDEHEHLLEGRWPVRCPGFTSTWLHQPPQPVGARTLPRGGSVTASDPLVAASATVLRCPFVMGPRFVRALVERCRPAVLRKAFGVTFGMACAAVAGNTDIGAVGDGDDSDLVDLYNRPRRDANDLCDNGQRKATDADQDATDHTNHDGNGHDCSNGSDDVDDDDDQDANSDRRRALRLTRQKGLARLRAMAESEYRRSAATTNPQYWVSSCPYEGCNATTRIDRMTAFNMVCIDCHACKRCYCSGCRETLPNDDSPEDAALRQQHEIGCYTYAHAPWFDTDVGFLLRFLANPTTAAAVDPLRPPRADAGASEADRPRTVLQILLDAGGGSAVRRAIAARIAECLIRADLNGSTQRCPTCSRRTNMGEARARTRRAATVALTRAHAQRDADAARKHMCRLANVYSTAVDWCPCGTVWCYLCERVCPVSRAQAKAAAVVGAAEWIDPTSSTISYPTLGAEFDPPPPPRSIDTPSSTSSTSSALPLSKGGADAMWAQREMARIYWHEAPEYGPWRHTSDWTRHARTARCASDPLCARRWPVCPPTMADLGDLCGSGFGAASAMAARARAGRSNLERFHILKRQRLTDEVMRCVEAVPWIGPDMVAAVREWVPERVWQRVTHSAGPLWSLSGNGPRQQQQQQPPLIDLEQGLRDHCASSDEPIHGTESYPSWLSMLDPTPLGPLY